MSYQIIPGSMETDGGTLTVGTMKADLTSIRYLRGPIDGLLAAYPAGTSVLGAVQGECAKIDAGTESVLTVVTI